jgi:hypothetical protein
VRPITTVSYRRGNQADAAAIFVLRARMDRSVSWPDPYDRHHRIHNDWSKTIVQAVKHCIRTLEKYLHRRSIRTVSGSDVFDG